MMHATPRTRRYLHEVRLVDSGLHEYLKVTINVHRGGIQVLEGTEYGARSRLH